MKTYPRSDSKRKAFTLLELTIVIMVLLALISLGFVASSQMNQWKRGRAAAETLRTVYTAQRMFLSDNPMRPVNSILPADLLPYMAGAPAALPTVQAMDDTYLEIMIDRSPPRINDGSGQPYDKSGSNNDSLWDVGE